MYNTAEKRHAYYVANKAKQRAARLLRQSGQQPAKTAKAQAIDLGVAIAHCTTPTGHIRTQEEIAAYCDCSRMAICYIEQSALKKLHRAICNDGDLLAYVYDLGMLRGRSSGS